MAFLGLLGLRRQRTRSNDLDQRASYHVEPSFRLSCVTAARMRASISNSPFSCVGLEPRLRIGCLDFVEIRRTLLHLLQVSVLV